ncbi:ROK family protein [Actinomyces radicidentis]|uniref:ROK family protein n=1 Tax=Actinomyces radicidentis TaxID=111015 RepID=UPI0028EB8E7B|nr:ROK family protein [Actinomyces radicidentis]
MTTTQPAPAGAVRADEQAGDAPGLLVGVDLGGTKIAASLVTPAGELVGEVRETPTPAHDGPEAMLDAIAGLVADVARAGSTADGAGRPVHPLAVGIGSAGVIDERTGAVLSSTDAITDWPGTDIAGGVSGRLERAGLTSPVGRAPLVHVDNDVNAYAAGEAWLGAGRGASSALVVAVGTGVGGAVVIDGQVHHGAHHLAGEMGHMPCSLAEGEPCTCGRPRHLEAVAGGPQIARRYREATARQDVTTALAVERLAEAGDPVAARVYEEAAVALGRAIAQVVTVLDPEVVIISGGLARSGGLWWGPLRATVAAELIDLVAGTELRPAVLGTSAPIVGAAHEAWLRLRG